MLEHFRAVGGVEVQYIAFVADGTVTPVTSIDGPTTVAIAAMVGKTRLIDNVLLALTTGTRVASDAAKLAMLLPLNRLMCSELFRIPYSWGGVPIFGFGVLLAVWALAGIGSFALTVRRQGWNAETLSLLPLLAADRRGDRRPAADFSRAGCRCAVTA